MSRRKATHLRESLDVSASAGLRAHPLMSGANSWYMSENIPGKPRAFLPYLGLEGVGGYRKKCDDVAASGYAGFALS